MESLTHWKSEANLHAIVWTKHCVRLDGYHELAELRQSPVLHLSLHQLHHFLTVRWNVTWLALQNSLQLNCFFFSRQAISPMELKGHLKQLLELILLLVRKAERKNGHRSGKLGSRIHFGVFRLSSGLN